MEEERPQNQTDTYDLQKELERKFDELFGPINDEYESFADTELSNSVQVSPETNPVYRTLEQNNESCVEESNDEEGGDNVVVLQDSNGNDVKFEFMDLIEYKNDEYVILLPTDGSEEDDASEVVILRLEEGEEESYCSVDDDNILNAVFEIFKEKFKDEFNFEK